MARGFRTEDSRYYGALERPCTNVPLYQSKLLNQDDMKECMDHDSHM